MNNNNYGGNCSDLTIHKNYILFFEKPNRKETINIYAQLSILLYSLIRYQIQYNYNIRLLQQFHCEKFVTNSTSRYYRSCVILHGFSRIDTFNTRMRFVKQGLRICNFNFHTNCCCQSHTPDKSLKHILIKVVCRWSYKQSPHFLKYLPYQTGFQLFSSSLFLASST